MGYYTSFGINIPTAKNQEEEDTIMEKLSKDYDNIKTYVDGDSYMKWYTFEDDMSEASLQFPNHIFEIDGQGEDYDDKWQIRFKNGEYERIEPEIVWPMYEKIVLDYEQIQEQADREIQIQTGENSSDVATGGGTSI